MQRPFKLRKLWRVGVGVAAAALIFSACGSSTTTTTTSSPVATTAPSHPKMGGTVYWAQAPGATPDYIFPFASLAYFSVANLTQFQYLMYRPLYWFGQVSTSAPTVDYQLSLANAPVWSNMDKTVTINLKGWKFSNGQAVDAQSVIFWLNMMKAEKLNWAGYAPGLFPDNVKSYSASSPTSLTVTINLTSAFNPTWYLYNQLSEIDPMPEAWDITALGAAPGSGGCGVVAKGVMTGASTSKACTAVWTFDTDDNGQNKSPHMAGDEATFASNPVWQVVDGPWRLSAYNPSNSEATFVPNAKYSGPQKPYLSKFVELPFTSDQTEFAALEAGGAGAPQIGYIPTQDITTAWTGKPGTIGPNFAALNGKFTLNPVYDWGINYFPENFQSNTDVGGGTNAGYVFDQLYVRQALQDGINQPAIIKAVDKGYGVPTYGPAPIYPTNTFATAAESTNPYPPSVTAGKALLTSHGWTEQGGVMTCTKPGTASDECGANINAGAKLTFKEVYANGTAAIAQTVDLETSAWAQEGISVSASSEPFDQVIGLATSCTMSQGSKCNWEMANWGGGWVYSPDYEPTGEEIFATGAGSNSGSYNNTENNTLIRDTNVSSSSSYFDTWEVFLGKQLPVVWQPNPAAQLAEISDQIGGVTPINALLNLTPEYWYYKS